MFELGTVLRTQAVVLALLAGGLSAQETGARTGPDLLAGGENAGGTGVWVLPRAALFSSPNYSYGSVALHDSTGAEVDATGLEWVRVDNHIAYFYCGNFVGADLDFFVPTANSGTTVDANLSSVGTWTRA